MTAHRGTGGLKKKLNLRSGSQRHRHFVGFFNVPVQSLTRTILFIRLFREITPVSRLLRHVYGDTEDTFSTLPPGPLGGVASKIPRHFENLDPPLICNQYENPLEISFSTTTKSLLTLMFRVLFNLLALVRTRHFCIHPQAMFSRTTLPISLTKDYGHFLRKGPNTDYHPGLILISAGVLSRKHFRRWCKKEGVEVHVLNDWKNEFLRIVDIRIENFTIHPHLYKQPPSRSVKALKRKMENYTVNMSLPLPTKQQITLSLSEKDTTWMF